jgi:hypothetical protein
MAWIKWLFEPIFEALSIDSMLSNAPPTDIVCGKLESYGGVDDD